MAIHERFREYGCGLTSELLIIEIILSRWKQAGDRKNKTAIAGIMKACSKKEPPHFPPKNSVIA